MKIRCLALREMFLRSVLPENEQDLDRAYLKIEKFHGILELYRKKSVRVDDLSGGISG